METTDMQAIRDALNNAKIDNGDRVREADYRMRKFYEQREAECIKALAILDKIDKSGEGDVVGWMDEDSHYSAYKHPAYPIPLVPQSAPAKAPAEVAPSPQAVTVEGILKLFAELCKETNVDLRTYGITDKLTWVKMFRTRLDQYLNNR